MAISCPPLSCISRPASVWGDYPGSDSGFCLRPAGQAQTLAQAQPEGQRALCPYAALAPGSTQCGETHGHETPGEERCVFKAQWWETNANSMLSTMPSEIIKNTETKDKAFMLSALVCIYFINTFAKRTKHVAAFEFHMHICTHNILCAGQQSMLCRSQSSWCDVSTNQDCRHYILY